MQTSAKVSDHNRKWSEIQIQICPIQIWICVVMFAELLTICRGFITVSGSVILTNCRENRPVFLWEMLISIKSPLPPNYNGEGSGKVIRNLYPGPYHHQKLTSCAARSPPQYAPPLFDFDLLTLKSVWESHVTWGTSVQSFVFLGLLVFELEPMYATSDRRTDGRQTPMTA